MVPFLKHTSVDPRQTVDSRPLRLAHRFYSSAIPFRLYIDRLNALDPSKAQIQLDLPESGSDSIHRAYHRLINSIIVAFPNDTAPTFPPEPTASLHLASAVPIDNILADVITTTLRAHKPSTAAQLNVLCAGFSIAHQDGHGSVFRNLDVRSPSAPVQTMLSPPWRMLLHCIGHVVFRHLLARCVLLLTVDNKTNIVEESQYKSAFLQICGPMAGSSSFNPHFRLPRSTSNILLKQDMLYHTPKHRRISGLSRKDNTITYIRNDGLPKFHHLHFLPLLPSAVSLLLPLIFLKRTSKFLERGSNTRAGCDYQESLSVRDYDSVFCKILKEHGLCLRGKAWLRLQKSVPQRLRKINPLLKVMVSNIQKSSFRRTLGKACPLPKQYRYHASKHAFLSIESLIKMNTTSKCVANFLVACCRQMFPENLFGSLRNKHIFEKAVHNFVRHRKLKESFDVEKYFARQSVVLTDVEWLYRPKADGKRVVSPTDLLFRQLRMYELFTWIFRGILVPLMQHNFFITEGNLNKNKVFFFRREIWTHLVDITNGTVLRANGQFAILSREQLAERMEQRDEVQKGLGHLLCPFPILVYHDIRYIPKRASLRGIQRPRSKMLSGFSSVSMNTHEAGHVLKQKKMSKHSLSKGLRCLRLLMNNILSILRAESHSQPESLGASVFSLNDIYERWLRFKMSWLKAGKPQLYACCVDVAKSFDTIPLTALIEDVIPQVLKNQRYPLVKTRVCKQDQYTGRVISRALTHVCLRGGEETSFVRLVRQRLLTRHSSSIICDSVNVSTLSRSEILNSLREFISNNVVSIPKRCRKNVETGFAVQVQGVPQGHPLSTILTSLFYGHVEREDLSRFFRIGEDVDLNEQKGVNNMVDSEVSLFMRQVDDTLYVSSHKSKARQFLRRMIEGWKTSHGFAVNADKTRTNFKADLKSSRDSRVLSWCGLLIDSNTLEIRNDCSRYILPGGRLRDHMTIEHDWESGRIWYERSLSCFGPKLHPLFLDQRINRRATIALNIYQAAVLCFLKVYAYVSALSDAIHNDKVALKAITAAMNNFIKMVIRTMRMRIGLEKKNAPLPLTHSGIYFLTSHAFHTAVIKTMDQHGAKYVLKGVKHTLMKTTATKYRMAKDLLYKNSDQDLLTMAEFFATKECGSLWKIRL